MDQAIIEALKKNEKAFGLMTEEMQAAALSVGKANLQIYGTMGGWVRIDTAITAYDDYETWAFRLSPDYSPAHKLTECKVYESEDTTKALERGLVFDYLGEAPYLHEAVDHPNFIGFESDGMIYGRLYRGKNNSVIVHMIPKSELDQYDVLPIDAVLFGEVK